MQMHTRGILDRASAKSAAGSPITFVAATDAIARDGLIIDANAWDLDNYRKSPVVLWSHDYTGTRPPIGKADNLRMEGGNMLADITFDQSDDFARQIEQKLRDGFLSTVSVGWDTKEMQATENPNVVGRVTKAELLDISVVNVPGDPNALMERQKRALAVNAHELLKLVEPDDDEEDAAPTKPAQKPETPAKPAARATWDETSAAMAGLFRPFAQRPDEERQTEYQKLARDYARHKKTPPEFLTQEALDALSADEVRGLFLEGEPDLHATTFAAMEMRAGAVLSQRNLDDLKQIADLATGIIERASKDTQKNANAEAERGTVDALEILKAALTKGTN